MGNGDFTRIVATVRRIGEELVDGLDGLDDPSFDLVVSIFGAMFAPRPLDTAREMVRVTRKGGRIVMGN